MEQSRLRSSWARLVFVGASALGACLACDSSSADSAELDAAAGSAGEPSTQTPDEPCVPEPPTLPTNVPEAIAAPEGVTLLRHFHAVGTQNYVCASGEWVFVAPIADLFNSCGTKVGTHFAVPNSTPPVPEWQYDVDGSNVTGAKLASAPVDQAIPELLLEAKESFDAGVFSTVSHVQRLRTLGGSAPAVADCDAEHDGDEHDVAYEADYYFYAAAP